jgi:hypothetical protein
LQSGRTGTVDKIQELAVAASAGETAIGNFTEAVGATGATQEEFEKLVASVRQSFSGVSEAALTLGQQVAAVAEVYTRIGQNIDTESVRIFLSEIARGSTVTRAFVDNLQQPISELTKLTASATGPLSDSVRLLNDTSQKMTESSAGLGLAMVGLANAIRDAAVAASRQ